MSMRFSLVYLINIYRGPCSDKSVYLTKWCQLALQSFYLYSKQSEAALLYLLKVIPTVIAELVFVF